jgi:hypothetical protein
LLLSILPSLINQLLLTERTDHEAWQPYNKLCCFFLQQKKYVLYFLEFSILNAFTKLQEVATTFVVFSIRPSVFPPFRLYIHSSVSMKHLHFLWTNFCVVLFREVSFKYAKNLRVLFKSAKLSGTKHKTFRHGTQNLNNFMIS